jgi:hypothetical protein
LRKKILEKKNILRKKNFEEKKICIKKNFEEKKFGEKKFWGKKINFEKFFIFDGRVEGNWCMDGRIDGWTNIYRLPFPTLYKDRTIALDS